MGYSLKVTVVGHRGAIRSSGLNNFEKLVPRLEARKAKSIWQQFNKMKATVKQEKFKW